VLQPPEPQVIQEEEEDSQTSRDADAASPPPLTDSTAAAVVRTLSPLLAPARLRSLQQAAVQRCRGVHLAFENVVQNDNVASALRTAECAGIHHVHLIRGPQALASKRGGSLKRVDNALSKGAERWLQLHYHYDVAGFLQAVRGAGLKLFGADVDASASTIADCDFGQTAESAGVSTGCGCGCAVIFGNERDGMSSELRAACDDLFFLPSVGLTQSYNVFVSAAMTVHHLQMRSVITPDCDGAQQQVPPNSLSYIPPPESDSEHSCFATYHVVSNYLLCNHAHTLGVSVSLSAIWLAQEILARWLLRDVARTQLEPALRQLQPSAHAMDAASRDGGARQDGTDDSEAAMCPSSETGDRRCSIDAAVIDCLLCWARLDVRAIHYGVKSELAVQS
jgi:tRNA (guanosine-2'-O-)-methyltransferase